MDDLVSENAIVDVVFEVVKEQVGRGKNFVEILSKALKVQGEYKVSMHNLIDQQVYSSTFFQ